MNTLLLYGVGQLGRLFGGGALRAGATVVPIRRDTDVGPLWSAYPPGTPILFAVGEAATVDALDRVPVDRRGDLIFVQNELYPSDLAGMKAARATLAIVWTNQKPGVPTLVGRATAVHGPHAGAMAAWHREVDIPCRVADASDIGIEAAAKYAFIVTVNALGLLDPRTVSEWLAADASRVDAVLAESVELAVARLGAPEARDEALERVRVALDGFGELRTRGRSSAARVARAVSHAEACSREVPQLASIVAAS